VQVSRKNIGGNGEVDSGRVGVIAKTRGFPGSGSPREEDLFSCLQETSLVPLALTTIRDAGVSWSSKDIT
jgi:hypothetical protein